MGYPTVQEAYRRGLDDGDAMLAAHRRTQVPRLRGRKLRRFAQKQYALAANLFGTNGLWSHDEQGAWHYVEGFVYGYTGLVIAPPQYSGFWWRVMTYITKGYRRGTGNGATAPAHFDVGDGGV